MNRRPNHKDDCDGSNFYYSGEGYNRVKVCSCGAEDHDPTEQAIKEFFKTVKKIAQEFKDETQHPS